MSAPSETARRAAIELAAIDISDEFEVAALFQRFIDAAVAAERERCMELVRTPPAVPKDD